MPYHQYLDELKSLNDFLTNLDCIILAILLHEDTNGKQKLLKSAIHERMLEEEQASEKYLSDRLKKLAELGFVQRERQNVAYAYWTTAEKIKFALLRAIYQLDLFSESEKDIWWEKREMELKEQMNVKSVEFSPCVEGMCSLDAVQSMRQNSRVFDMFIFSMTTRAPPSAYKNEFFHMFRDKLLQRQMFRIRRIVHPLALQPGSFYAEMYKAEINFIRQIISKHTLQPPQDSKFIYEIRTMNWTKGENQNKPADSGPASFPILKPLSFFGSYGSDPDQGVIGYFTHSLREFLLQNKTHFLQSHYTFQFISDLFENFWLMADPVGKSSASDNFEFVTLKEGGHTALNLMDFGVPKHAQVE